MALTDFIQMIVLVVGLSIIAVMAGNMAGGADKVIAYAQKDMFNFFPEPSLKDMLFFVAAAITMMLGSIPQRDVFQRVMSAKRHQGSDPGPGDWWHLLSAVRLCPDVSGYRGGHHHARQSRRMLKSDPQKILPTLVLEHAVRSPGDLRRAAVGNPNRVRRQRCWRQT